MLVIFDRKKNHAGLKKKRVVYSDERKGGHRYAERRDAHNHFYQDSLSGWLGDSIQSCSMGSELSLSLSRRGLERKKKEDGLPVSELDEVVCPMYNSESTRELRENYLSLG